MTIGNSKALNALADIVGWYIGQGFLPHAAFKKATGRSYDSSLGRKIEIILDMREALAQERQDTITEKERQTLSEAIELELLRFGDEFGYHLSPEDLLSIKARQEEAEWEVIQRE